MELERVADGPLSESLPGAESVVAPLSWRKWEEELMHHPDKEWVEFLVRDIRCDSRLGHDQARGHVQCKRRFMYKALEHKEVVTDYLGTEVASGRVWKVTDRSLVQKVQCSPFGIIPKKEKPGRWCLIVNFVRTGGLECQ